jgi:Na+/H+ antiporter NhaD/arsenite permease-like protein
MILTLCVFISTLILIMVRPKPLNEATAASSMLWLVLLRQRGLDIHPLQYLKLGLMVTPPMLIASALALYASSVFWS